METLEKLNFLKNHLKLEREIIHPEFFAFHVDEIGHLESHEDKAHYTEFFEITIALKDSGQLMIGEHKYSSLSHTISLVSPGQLELYIPSEFNEKDDVLVILFKASFLKHYKENFQLQNKFPIFHLHSKPIYKLKPEDIKKLYDIGLQIIEEENRNDTYSIEIIRALLILLLNKISRKINKQYEQISLKRFQSISQEFEFLVIEKHKYRWNVKDYAQKMNISPLYLAECVKKTTGKPPKQIISDYQILTAKSLLVQTQDNIAKIASYLGFEEITNFTKFFKKLTGQTPREFRKESNNTAGPMCY